MSGDSSGACYDVRLRCHLGPAVREYLAPGSDHVWTGPGTVLRVSVTDCQDLIGLYQRLVEHDVEVCGIRRVT